MPRTAPRARSTDRRFYGVVEALVVENQGDDEGRVKVRFPWFDGGSTVTEWCRVSQLYAGGGYGSLFVPEVGDEVLVAFVHGDMRFPIVLGGLYNGVDKPPTAPTGGRDQKIIRTKAGHEVLFDDAAKLIRITTADGGDVTVTATGEIRLKARKVTVEADAIDLGGGATQAAVLGDALKAAFDAHTHTSATAGAPTSPPVLPLPGSALSAKVKVE
ncbi:type IV secretion protein Rhs [Spongiactinospora rosea]|uniref:Type IV secretion protein Rhs n=1 Tax=Spongiactinospora rosea TaxID=2248750 RepID=A0A366LPB3_9ACTN|nr:phage baseplate assembly protein V [Spongiactinospora rosea]RBQ14992.1 type IV secretion protein Rhs [Spongiactinospora rosea]